ncbi:MAG: putative metal-dependent hydrolase of the TIM-barrel fold protein [Planctomycetota bacterium]|nr:putative metal-dependent hydrolase of the TIM-barrel fold protein [Planctomycetota bacterium]
MATRSYPIVDAHVHCFAGRVDPRFPYHPDAPYRPERPATPEHLLVCMDEADVDLAVIAHPEPYQDDHRYLDYCLNVGEGRLLATCLFFADHPGSLERMSELVKLHPGKIVAARIHAYAPERLPPFGSPELRAFWKHAGDLGLAIQIHIEPRYAPGFEPMIREFPETTVIVDHLGRPMQGGLKEYAVVLGWGSLPNVVVKLSAIPDREQYPHRDPAPFVRQLLDRFGPDRLIFGGDFGPESTGDSYRAARERVRPYLASLSTEDHAKIFGGTAARLLGLFKGR